MQLAPRQLDLFRAPLGPRSDTGVDAARAGSESQEERAQAVAQTAAAVEDPTTAVEGAPASAPERTRNLERAKALGRRLATLLGGETRVLLTVHDNRSTMLSFRRRASLLRVRLHHMFLDAPEPVLRAVVDYAQRGRRSAGAQLDAFIAERQGHIRPLPPSGRALVSRGRRFDLREVFDRLNAEYFEGRIAAAIGWGRGRTRRRRRSIRLGVYDHRAREIRIHPLLDRASVPLYFVEFIVFHEMLHQEFPTEHRLGRRAHHPPEFRARERTFRRYEAAVAWEREHIGELLGARGRRLEDDAEDDLEGEGRIPGAGPVC